MSLYGKFRGYFNEENFFGKGLTTRQKFTRTLRNSAGVSLLDVAFIGFQVRRSDRGGFVPAVFGQTLVLPVGVLADVALSLIPGVGPALSLILGTVLLGRAELGLGTQLSRGIRVFTDANKKIRHLEMGGDYRDTELASRQRMIALQDMNSAMIPGRRYLGQEARLMHR